MPNVAEARLSVGHQRQPLLEFDPFLREAAAPQCRLSTPVFPNAAVPLATSHSRPDPSPALIVPGGRPCAFRHANRRTGNAHISTFKLAIQAPDNGDSVSAIFAVSPSPTGHLRRCQSGKDLGARLPRMAACVITGRPYHSGFVSGTV